MLSCKRVKIVIDQAHQETSLDYVGEICDRPVRFKVAHKLPNGLTMKFHVCYHHIGGDASSLSTLQWCYRIPAK